MTDDLISRQAAIDLFPNDDLYWDTFDGYIAPHEARRLIKDMPVVDAVPVIRCKECKHWLPHEQFGYDADNDEYHNYCGRLVPDDDYYAFTREADEFCSRAERKEE